MKPYFEEDGITIYHGDCREIMPALSADSVITDPVWPNASKLLAGAGDPFGLLEQSLQRLPDAVRTLTIHLGVLSDPRILACVPKHLTFFRVCWLPMLPVSFCGIAVNGGDVAYVFGTPPGTGIIGGECNQCGEKSLFPSHYGRNRSPKAYQEAQAKKPHPSPRKIAHVRWLMKRFGYGTVLDPFAGSGTTLLAAKLCGLKAIGIEIEERHCELIVKRLSPKVFDFGEPVECPS